MPLHDVYEDSFTGGVPGLNAPSVSWGTGMPTAADYTWDQTMMGLNLGPAQNIASTFETDPGGYWQAARMQQLGQRAFLPQFRRTINQGFTPAYGGFLMGAPSVDEGAPSFGQYLGAGTTESRQAQAQVDWSRAIEASRRTDPTYTPVGSLGQLGYQAQLHGYLQGPNARSNALAMAQAGLGPARGLAAQARQRALGNLYDIYAARAAGTGQGPGGFLGYLGGQMGL